jgi:imidazolonepropionase
MKKKDLLSLAEERVDQFVSQGVTTIEIKTGYGLSFESEKKCLEIIAGLKKSRQESKTATIRATFLAAHALRVASEIG